MTAKCCIWIQETASTFWLGDMCAEVLKRSCDSSKHVRLSTFDAKGQCTDCAH